MRSKRLVIVSISLIIVSLASASIFVFPLILGNYGGVYALSTSTGFEPVAVLNGEPVYPHEYFVFFREQVSFFEDTAGQDIWELSFGDTPAETQAKLNALRQLSLVRTVVNAAQSEGISLPQSALDDAQEAALSYLQSIPESLAIHTGSTLDTILPVMINRQMLEYMYDRTTSNFAVSQVDFEDFFEGYILAGGDYVRVAATVLQVHPEYIDIEHMAHTLSTYGLEGLAPFLHAISNTYQTDDLSQEPLPLELSQKARLMEAGDVSIVSTPLGYYIILVNDRLIPNLETLTQSALSEYKRMRRDEIFHQQYLAWRDNEPRISLNDDVFTAISILDLRP